MKPLWLKFKSEYPDYATFPDSAAVKSKIGGAVNADYITNSCAIRLSRGLNYSGTLIPSQFPGLVTVRGGDDKRYALRVREMRSWLRHAFGKPDFDLTKQAGIAFDKSSIAGSKGIIAFDIHFSDASGHLDIWDGNKFSSEYKVDDYWTKATRITIWKLP